MESEDFSLHNMVRTQIPAKAKTARTLLVLCNVIFIGFGGILLSLGLYAQLNHGFLSEIAGSALYMSAAYMSIVCGFFTMFLGAVGLRGAAQQRKGELLFFLVVALLLALVCLCAALMATLFRATLTSTAKGTMLYTLQRQYGKKRLITEAWELTQANLRCCGVESNGWSVYNNSEWDLMVNADERNKNLKISQNSPLYKFVPASCCLALIDPRTMWPSGAVRNAAQCQYWPYGPPNRNGGGFNDALYYRGCFDAIAEFAGSHARFFAGFGIFLFIVLVVGIVCAFVIIANVTPAMIETRKNAKNAHFQSQAARPLLTSYE